MSNQSQKGVNIDDLGRVVIPKEIRLKLKLREGAPLEIYTTKDGEIIFRRYEPFDKNEVEELISKLDEMDVPVPFELMEIKKRMEERE